MVKQLTRNKMTLKVTIETSESMHLMYFFKTNFYWNS